MSLDSLITLETLAAMASRRTFDAGEACFLEGKVHRFEGGVESARARVQGSNPAPYATRFKAVNGQLQHSCTCEAGMEGEFCKHQTATGFAWLDWRKDDLAMMGQLFPPAPVEAPRTRVLPAGVRTADALLSPSGFGRRATTDSTLAPEEDALISDLVDLQMGRAPRQGAFGQGYAVPRPAEAPREPVTWHRPGAAVTVHGVTITAGFVHTGGRPSGFRALAPVSLLDERLPVASSGNPQQWLGSAFPDYISLTPNGRRAYLQWHADGRKDAWVHLNYVQLFLCGLEYRILVENTDPTYAQDVTLISEELERIQRVYGSRMNGPMRATLCGLQDWLLLTSSPAPLYETQVYAQRPGQASVNLVKAAVAQSIALKGRIDADLAFEWVLQNPGSAGRGYATQYPDALRRCFRSIADQHVPNGFTLTETDEPLRLNYRALSPGLQEFVRPPAGFSDLALPKNPKLLGGLRDILTACALELDAYARFCIRNPGTRESLEASLLLPLSALAGSVKQHLASLPGETGQRVLSLQDVFAGFTAPDKPVDQWSRSMLGAFGNRLTAAGLGMEPDVLRSGKLPALDTQVAVFLLGEHPEESTDVAWYAPTMAVIRLMLAVVQPQGESLDVVRQFVHEELEHWPEMGPALKPRIKAALEIELLATPSMTGVKSALRGRTDIYRDWAAGLMLRAAQLEGNASPAMVKALEKAYKTLERDPKAVFGDLHAESTRPSSPRHAAKKGNQAATRGFTLDTERIAQLQADTAKTAVLLGAIFTEDDALTAAAPVPESSPQPAGAAPAPAQEVPALVTAAPTPSSRPAVERLLGLDAAHSAIVRAMLERKTWDRETLSALARQHGRMLDGALEKINDASFDELGVPFFEGEDPVEINTEVLESLQ